MSFTVWFVELAAAKLQRLRDRLVGGDDHEEKEAEEYKHPLLETDMIVRYLWDDPDAWKALAQATLTADEFAHLDTLATKYLNGVNKVCTQRSVLVMACGVCAARRASVCR
jgi:hypothetical protein